jgi:hypothetical protein
MKRIGIFHMTVLFLALGIAGPACGRQGKPDKQEDKAKPGKPEREAKPERQHQERSSKQGQEPQVKEKQDQRRDGSARQQQQDNSGKRQEQAKAQQDQREQERNSTNRRQANIQQGEKRQQQQDKSNKHEQQIAKRQQDLLRRRILSVQPQISWRPHFDQLLLELGPSTQNRLQVQFPRHLGRRWGAVSEIHWADSREEKSNAWNDLDRGFHLGADKRCSTLVAQP